MNKIKYITFALISIFIFNLTANAAGGSLSVNTSSVNIGESFSGTVSISDAVKWDVSVYADGGVSGCNVNSSGGNGTDTESTNIPFTCEATSEGSINVYLSGKVYLSLDEEPIIISQSKTVNVRSRVLSSDNNLKSLTIDGVEKMNGSKTYTDADSITISAIKNDETAKISGDIGAKSLNYGDNTFYITVVAENGNERTYTLYVYRNGSNNAYLASLSVSKGNINFNRASLNYSINVDSDVETITINAQVEDPKSTVEGTGTKNLKLGNNTFNVTVHAEDGTTKTYVIKVNRKDNRSSNNKLKSLSISDGKLEFDSDKTEYELVVDYEITKVSFKAKAEDDKSTITGLEERELEVGTNVFNISVKAENGSVRTYQVTVIRNKEVVETNENKAKNIIIKGHALNFDPDETEYVLETRLSSLDINVELNSVSSTVEITGNENLHDGSIIQITITDKEGNNNIYTIKISNPYEGQEDNDSLVHPFLRLPKFVYYIIMWCSIVITLVVLILVFREKNNISTMLHKNKNIKVREEPTPTIDNSGLFGEPTYQTLEMAKIDLEDYLDDEKRAKHKKKKVEEVDEPTITDFEHIADIEEETIEEAFAEKKEAIVDEEVDNDNEEKESIIQEESPKMIDEVKSEEVVEESPKETEKSESPEEVEETVSQTRSDKHADKATTEIAFITDSEIKDDIDDYINATNALEIITEENEPVETNEVADEKEKTPAEPIESPEKESKSTKETKKDEKVVEQKPKSKSSKKKKSNKGKTPENSDNKDNTKKKESNKKSTTEQSTKKESTSKSSKTSKKKKKK